MNNSISEILSERFDPSLIAVPYADDTEFRRDWMALIAQCLVAAAACKINCAEKAASGDDTPNLPGTLMEVKEAMCHLGCLPVIFTQPEGSAELLAHALHYVESRETATLNACEAVPRPLRLKYVLGLSNFSYFALHCALACVLDRGFERLFVALHGDESAPHPTLGAVQTLYSFVCPERELEWIADPSSLENRLLFAPVHADKPILLRPFTLRPSALCHILGEPYLSSELAACSTVINGSGQGSVMLFAENQQRAVRAALQKMRFRKEPRLCVLCGEAGNGKKLALHQLAQEEGECFILVRLDEIPEKTHMDDIMDELLSLALLDGITLSFSMKTLDSNLWIPRILTMMKQYRLGVFLLVDQMNCHITPDGYLITRIEYPAPNLEQSLKFWQMFSSKYDANFSIDWAQLAVKYRLTPGQIKTALCTAIETSSSQDSCVNEEIISKSILLGNEGRLSKIADRIEAFYTWDDLVLGDAPMRMLRDVCDRIKYRHIVEIQWGFGGKSSYGKGISVLFYGPPGTGKTMSAQVIAGELGLPLYRINLAQIISKYIGETAKNLNAVFNEAKSSNAILFFDEADALFAKRTDVTNSNDRHANSDSAYLLQKIEEYPGISVLATNLASNIDDAFRRRISYMINIHMPGSVQRLALWRGSFPEKAPLSSDVDLRILADNLEVSGSVIKSAALQAAYFAAAENAQIGMVHLARAVRLELQKLGKSEPNFLTMYP